MTIEELVTDLNKVLKDGNSAQRFNSNSQIVVVVTKGLFLRLDEINGKKVIMNNTMPFTHETELHTSKDGYEIYYTPRLTSPQNTVEINSK